MVGINIGKRHKQNLEFKTKGQTPDSNLSLKSRYLLLSNDRQEQQASYVCIQTHTLYTILVWIAKCIHVYVYLLIKKENKRNWQFYRMIFSYIKVSHSHGWKISYKWWRPWILTHRGLLSRSNSQAQVTTCTSTTKCKNWNKRLVYKRLNLFTSFLRQLM